MAAGLHGPGKDIWSISLYEDIAVVNSFLGEEFRYSALASGILAGVLASLVSIANAIVIAAIWKDPYKQLRSSPSNIIIASMACCDFLVGVVCSSAQCYAYINSWMKGKITKNAVFISYASGIFFVGISLANVVVLTIDRVLSVTNPLLYKVRVTKSRLIKALAFIWVFYVVVALLHYPLRYHTYIYLTATHALQSLSILISCSLSLLILYRVRRQTHELKVNRRLNANMRKFMERNRKVTKTILLIVVLLLACCFAPLVALVSTTCFSCGVTCAMILMTSYNFCIVLLHINSLVNPFLYAFRLPKFKKPVKLIIKCLVNCKRVEEYKPSNSIELIAAYETPTIKRNETMKTSLGSDSEDTKF